MLNNLFSFQSFFSWVLVAFDVSLLELEMIPRRPLVGALLPLASAVVRAEETEGGRETLREEAGLDSTEAEREDAAVAGVV